VSVDFAQLAPLALALLCAGGAGMVAAWLHGRGRLASRERETEGLLHQCRRLEDEVATLREYQTSADERMEGLRRAIVQIPDLARELASAREPREIAPRTLDLVEEIFEPAYAVFYRTRRDGLVAVAARGATELRVGHRLAFGEGVVGWTAQRQVTYTGEDADHETPRVKKRHLAACWPLDFSVCLPLVVSERTVGVVLVGPCREQPQARELGRTVALLASVALQSTALLRQQRLLAQTDGLTGLLNKRQILMRLEEYLRAERERKLPVSVFLFDIDHFKQYNDGNGHLAGDDLLRGLGRLLREHLREDEYVGRYGGEEFLLVLPGTRKQDALRAAERLRRLVQEQSFPHGEHQPGGRLTLSGGVAAFPEDGVDAVTLIGRADEALYTSKHRGRNRVTGYEAPVLGGTAPDALFDEPEAIELVEPAEKHSAPDLPDR